MALRQLGVQSFADFWAIWGEGSEPFPGQLKYGFWHVAIWSWFANAAMHIGMSDLSVFRFARNAASGWTSAAGMYIGHFMAWIAAALLYAVYIKSSEAQQFLLQGEAPPVAPGPLAYNALGVFGVLVVIMAGWTTANPTIYRAGLAFQAIFKNTSRFRITLLAGGLSTLAGMFPAVAMKLLDFVALYGFILAPMGAIIVFQHFFGRSFKIIENYAEIKKISVNWAVLVSWVLAAGGCYLIAQQFDIFLSFMTLPAWICCGLLFLILSKKAEEV